VERGAPSAQDEKPSKTNCTAFGFRFEPLFKDTRKLRPPDPEGMSAAQMFGTVWRPAVSEPQYNIPMRTIAILALICGQALAAGPIVDTAKSPHAAFHPVAITSVKMGSGFWEDRRKINLERSLPSMLQLFEQNGWIDNFRRLSGKAVSRRGPLYTDSDVYKWMEAVAWQLAAGDVPQLRADFDRLTDIIVAVQEPSGYLNTYYQEDQKPKRFTEMVRSHELYCLGHLLQAAIAYYRVTGNRKLLDAGIRYADYVVSRFGVDEEPAMTGHPEFEMALAELYRVTGQRKYLDFAGYLLSGVETQRLHLTPAQTKYAFSGSPFTGRTIFEGHAVRAMYAASGATDYYMETGDPAYQDTLDRLWQDLVSYRLYITGGVGSRASGEAFGEPYELPNAQAYTESCAAIATFMWNWRMLLAFGESKYADVMERSLYNGINSGMSLDGTLYCYRNPLESTGEKIRNEFYDTDCCPPNLERTFAALPGYLYAASSDGIAVNFYHTSTMDAHGVKISQTTEYPWNGRVELRIDGTTNKEWNLRLRIPAWSSQTSITVNGQPVASQIHPQPGRFAEIRRAWKAGDIVVLNLDMRPRFTSANPLLREDMGRVAVERGPLVYCLEQGDQPSLRLFESSLTQTGEFKEERRPDLLGGLIVLHHAGTETAAPLKGASLYQTFPSPPLPKRPIDLALIPYYAWANRGPSNMEVWIPLGGL
jgi:DUF1680 family protein